MDNCPPETGFGDAGFGDRNAQIKVYIGNKPAMPEYHNLKTTVAIDIQKITAINQHCGNGWRKVFNVYAKLVFELRYPQFSVLGDWQSLRDQLLLTEQGNAALIFGLPNIKEDDEAEDVIHIICGRTHAKPLLNKVQFTWLSADFALCKQHRIIISPYFDYRQLSNVKIHTLVQLIHSLSNYVPAKS